MCRTCYLTGYTDEIIEEFYKVGTEIDIYRTPEEPGRENTPMYLARPDAAERLQGAQGSRRRQARPILGMPVPGTIRQDWPGKD